MMECNGIVPDKEEDLSDYTDADESISAPTEILAEFLSAVMLKDYDAALKYCKMILQYEPNHATAKEFYPLILEKIIQGSAEAMHDVDLDGEGEGDVESSSDSERESSDDNSLSESDSESGGEEEEEEVEEEEEKPSDSDATTASYSSLEDEEADNHHTPFTPDDNAFVSTVPAHNNNNFSDSESPTEPVSQAQLASRLRSQVLPTRL